MSFVVKASSRNKQIYEQWSLIQDLIGPANRWPIAIRRYFCTRNLKNYNRLLITAFIFINGLPPNVFLDWCQLMHLLRDKAAINHIYYLLDKFKNSSKYDKTVYGFHTGLNRYIYLDGSTRFYTK